MITTMPSPPTNEEEYQATPHWSEPASLPPAPAHDSNYDDSGMQDFIRVLDNEYSVFRAQARMASNLPSLNGTELGYSLPPEVEGGDPLPLPDSWLEPDR